MTATAEHHHPGARAANSINNAAQVALCLSMGPRDVPSIDECNEISTRIVALLADARSDVAALELLLQRQERVLEEMRIENVRLTVYARRVEEKNSELSEGVIRLTNELEKATAVAGGALTQNEPRDVAAVGGT